MLSNFIQSYASRWANDLHMERTIGLVTKNSMAFSGVASFGEVLCSLLTGMYGKGGSGSGHDLSNGRFAAEVKTVCWAQPWKCEICEKRSPHTSKLCVHCGSNNIINPRDSRAGISASAHLKYIDTLASYYIVLIDHVKDDIYSVHVWVIDSSNPYFHTYVKQQSEQKSKTCNFIPRSYDFHMSGPKLIYEIKLLLENEPKFELVEHDKIEDMPVSVLKTKAEKALFPEFETHIPYDIALERLAIRNKCYGKPRGETTRCL